MFLFPDLFIRIVFSRIVLFWVKISIDVLIFCLAAAVFLQFFVSFFTVSFRFILFHRWDSVYRFPVILKRYSHVVQQMLYFAFIMIISLSILLDVDRNMQWIAGKQYGSWLKSAAKNVFPGKICWILETN